MFVTIREFFFLKGAEVAQQDLFHEPNLLIPNHLLVQQKEEVTDWRKNVDAMSGMEGRKKLFDAGQ